MIIGKIIPFTASPISTPVQRFWDSARHFLLNETDVFFKSKEGNTIKAELIKPTKKDWYIVCQKHTLGEIHFVACTSRIVGDNLPEYYKDKPYMYLKSPLKSNRTYKNIGTELIKAAVRESQRLGFEGRVCLNASTINPEIGSPVPFYYKMGFKSVSKQKQAIIEDCMKNKKPLPPNCESTTMYLPREAIQELLGK